MGVGEWIAIVAIALAVGGAIGYIVKAKQSGTHCIGCPNAGKCGGCTGCNTCHSEQQEIADAPDGQAKEGQGQEELRNEDEI